MPLIRTRADIDNKLGGPTPAEWELLIKARAGLLCELPQTDRAKPPKSMSDPAVHVRADVLRYLISGGCAQNRVADWGVRLHGAYISGQLDISHGHARGLTKLKSCTFEHPFLAQQCRFDALNLEASHLVSLKANGAEFAGDVVLEKTKSNGCLDFKGAVIQGELTCAEARIVSATRSALMAESVRIEGDVDLKKLRAIGEVNFAGGRIGGQLSCEGIHFEKTERFAFYGHRMRVEGSFVWRPEDCRGMVDLSSAYVGDLVDDLESWQEEAEAYLNGFEYEGFAGAKTLTVAQSRERWLDKGATWRGTFFPQPYTQLAKVLRSVGHDSDARKILAKREQLLHRDFRNRLRNPQDGVKRNYVEWIGRDILGAMYWLCDIFLLRMVIGYGHHPFRSLIVLVVLIVFATAPAHRAWKEGSFAPNSGPILVSDDWQALVESEENPAAVWAGDLPPATWDPVDPACAADAACRARSWREAAPGRDWETFNRYAYAVDVVIPIIDIGQTQAWAPSTTRGPWGYRLWWLKGVLTLLGWIVTALGAAAITGIIRRD